MCLLNVENIKLINFRNYKNIYLELNKNMNIFIGKNAQGKTNLIEAIYMASKGNSFKSNSDKEIIKFGENKSYIGCNIKLRNYNRLVEILLEKNNPKKIKINKTLLESKKDLNSGLNIVLFSPDDLKIIKDGPSLRRNFIDNSLSQIKPIYKYNISQYKKILYQRNSLLKTNKRSTNSNIKSLINVFDLQLVKIGTNIIIDRNKYIDILNEYSKKIHYEISNNSEFLNIKYNTNINLENLNRKKIENRYLELLNNTIDRDLKYGNTLIGPHRDDLIALINEKDVRVYGSQGQQRSTILSLKLAEVNIIKDIIGLYPVLLLDDLFSELDKDRRKHLVDIISKTQTIITSTNSESLEILKKHNKSIYYIDNGMIKNNR